MAEKKGTRWSRVLVALSFGSWLVVLKAFFPGFYTGDSISQYLQATLPGHLDDWHPPIFAVVWKYLIKTTGLTSSMLILQLTMVWLSITLLSVGIYKLTRSRVWSLTPFLFLGASPYVLMISGTVWKDVHLGASMLLASSIVFYGLYVQKPQGRQKYAYIGLLGALLAYAGNLRHGLPVVVVPIAFSAALGLSKKFKTRLGYVVATVALVYMTGFAVKVLFKPHASNVQAAIMLDDITALDSAEEIRSLHVSQQTDTYLLDIKDKCDKIGATMNKLFVCRVGADRFVTMAQTDYDAVKQSWIETIKKHPVDYVKFRLDDFHVLLEPEGIYAWDYERVSPNDLGLVVPNSRATIVFEKVAKISQRDYAFGYKAYFWVVLSILGLAYSYKARHRLQFTGLVVPLYLSGLVHLAQFIPATIAADYRYIYWLAISTTLATLLLFVDVFGMNKESTKKLRGKA